MPTPDIKTTPQKWWEGKRREEVNDLARKFAREAADKNHKPTYLRGSWDGVRYNSILCRICEMTSHNQNDADALYCGNCKAFHVPVPNIGRPDAVEKVLAAVADHPATKPATQGSSKMSKGVIITGTYFAIAWATFGLMYHSDTCKPLTANDADMRIPCSMAFGTLWPILIPLKAAIFFFDPSTKLPRIQFSNEPAK